MAHVSCRDCVELMLDYLDGSLSPEKERELDEHIGGCPPCVDFVWQYRGSSELGKRALEAEMPEEMVDRLSAYLGQKCK